MNLDECEFYTRKELAAKVKRSRSFILAATRRGFRFVGGVTTLQAWFRWIERNPAPCSRKGTQR